MEEKKELWMVQTKRADFSGLAMRLGVSPVAVRVMRNRGLTEEAEMRKYLYGTLDDLYDPRLMKGMEQAAELIARKLKEGKHVRIIGDYDIDGVCSTYILLKGFQRAAKELSQRCSLEAGRYSVEKENDAQIDYEIPDRIKDGYGINESIIRQASADGVDTLVTCDNGIAALREISIAKQLGMTVVVTDHHEVPVDEYGQILPPADAVVDPKQDGETYPFHEICGAVVAWKLIRVLYEKLGIPESEWMDLLEFAAIATVGDVMKLQDENRLIVKYGLKKIGSTKNTGLRKLIEKNNLDIENLSAYHIGFVIGPCLNAGGRLKSAKVALRMLLAEDPERAGEMADELKELNDMRKDMTAKGETEAIEQVEKQYMDDKVLVVFLPECHESLAGIIAGRLREHFHKPSFVLTRGETTAKGSGRSIQGLHMRDALERLDTLYPGMMLKFGGHAMAAGLSLEEDKFELFQQRFGELVTEWLDPSLLQGEVVSDGPLSPTEMTMEVAQLLRDAGPWGQMFPEPLFDGHFRLLQQRLVGERHLKVMVEPVGGGPLLDGIAFNVDTALWPDNGVREVQLAYKLDINEFRGNRSLQIIIDNIWPI